MASLKLEKLDFHLNAASIGQGMTQSEMQCWDNCPEKWYLGYNLMLALRGKHSWALTYGSWIHEALDEYYKTKGKRWHIDPKVRDKHFLNAQQLSEYDYWVELANVQMSIYASHYKNDFKFFNILTTEEIIEFEWQGVLLKGMVDMFLQEKKTGKFFMKDHKTTGKIDKQVVMGWDFRLQFMFYVWLCLKTKRQSPSGYFVNAMKKPQLKQGANETTKQFLQRVQIDMLSRPEVYFYRERLVLLKGDMEHFEKNILQPKIDRLKVLQDPKVSDSIKIMMARNKNTDYCLHYGQPCEFMRVCKNGLAVEKAAYRKREVKHMELVETE